VLCRTLLLLCAGAVETGAGTRRLDRLGGLIHRMPVSAICSLAGLFGVAVLPPGLGFAGFWLLFQSLLAAARIGGFGLQLLIAIVAALIALSVGFASFASVRLFGVVFLGRPRTPRTAVAEDVAFPARGVLIGLASLTGLLGLVPALALLPAARALATLANGGSGASEFALILQAGAEAPGYAPIVIAALLLIAGCALLWLLHRGVAQRQRQEAAWSGGFAPPPAWLPFGDPATQYGPASFADPLQRAERSLLARPEATARRIVAKLARQRERLLHALIALGDADASRSVAAALVVVVLATLTWLVAS
jgi:NADH:ubiquinone oxidoreductase subunit 5 (subunit L)/multisubunit Na+/H+ antiporter MnhA subunit